MSLALNGKRGDKREGLELVFASFSKPFPLLKLCCLSCRIGVTWMGLRIECLFDVAFVMKWVQTQGDVVACSDGNLASEGS